MSQRLFPAGLFTSGVLLNSTIDRQAQYPNGPYIAATAGGYSLSCDPGSYELTGQSANLLFGRKITAEQGSYALTGQDVTFIYGGSYSFTAETGFYTLIGSAALVDIGMSAESGSYTLTGQDATLTYSPLNNYSLIAESGSYTLTGQEVNLLRHRTITADQGQYNLTGFATGFSWSGAPATGYSNRSLSIGLRLGL
jgi:hypothetical protein